MVTKKDRLRYGIESTTKGFPELELALHKAAKQIGWKYLSAHTVKWFNEHQPIDGVYSLPFWQKEAPLEKALERRPKTKDKEKDI